MDLKPEQLRNYEGALPSDTLAYLASSEVPDSVQFRGDVCSIDLSLEPVGKGAFLRIGELQDLAAVLELNTGFFGFLDPEGQWTKVNSSISQFVQCAEAAKEVFSAEQSGTVGFWERGPALEARINLIDPDALANPESPWAFLVEEFGILRLSTKIY